MDMVGAVGTVRSGSDELLNIWDYMLEKYNPPKVSACTCIVTFPQKLYENRAFSSRVSRVEHAQLYCPELFRPFSRDGCMPKKIPIKAAQMLTEADEETNVKRIMELTMESTRNYYQPGDTIAILPCNNIKDVQRLIQKMQIAEKSHSIFELGILPECLLMIPHIPKYCTPYLLLRDCLNLHATPKKQFLSALAECCTDANENIFLGGLSSKEGSDYYNKLILERGLTLLDLLILCPSCKPTLGLLIEHLPGIFPRPYSIANSPRTNEIKIIYSTLTQKPGLTTNMLSNLAAPLLAGDTNTTELPKVMVYDRPKTRFRFTATEASEHNHILIGVGTAISPFLGFLERKEQLLAEENAIKSLGITWLFTGGATEKSLPHRERIMTYKESKVLDRYYECLSRVPNATYRYVHEQLLALAFEFVEFFLDTKTTLYVCADAESISKSIENAIAECLAQVQRITPNEASDLIKAFKTIDKYRENLWL